MNEQQIRETFEAHYPLPNGVWWMGEHYTGTKDVIGSFRNASEWDAMWRGFMAAAKEFGHVG